MATDKILLAALALTLLLSLSGLPFPNPVAATPDEVNKWSRVKMPTEGEASNWVLASGSNIQHLTLATDGSLYSYANPSGTSDTLFKSTDAGANWLPTGKVKDAIVAIATASDNATVVYYATISQLYKSVDAGNTFTPFPPKPGGAGSNNITITSIDIAREGNNYLVAVGTRDTDSSQYGGVYILNENQPLWGWSNANIGNYDVLTVAFSPNFTANQQLVAVVTNEQDTLVTTKVGDADWGQNISDATINDVASQGASIAFPDNYGATQETFILFVGINSTNNKGDAYIIYSQAASESSIATDLNIGFNYGYSQVDVAGLAVSGNTTGATLLAGAAGSAQIYISTDSGVNWTRSTKAPSGQSRTEVLMAADFTSSRRAYVATSGTESAFSNTTDGGISWNQVSLIDTTLSNIVDLAPSPDYAQDNTLFLLTFDGGHIEHSLWRSRNSGAKWERVLTSTIASADSLNLVKLPRQYGNGRQVVFLAGTKGSNSVIWQSTDNGQTFSRRDAPFSIDIWTVVSDNNLFLGSYNGTNGLVYSTTNGGLSYSTGAVAGSQPLKSITLSPNYEQDKTMLIGNTSGWVYWSSDNGTSFKPLPPDATSPPLTGSITVAFDPDFGRNNTVYAASNDANKGIYRYIINKSTSWARIDGTLPSGGTVSQIRVASDGTLYATNSKANDGMERSLNPTYPLGVTFETVSSGLDDGATLSGLWLGGNQLWSVDTHNTKLMTYTDSLTSPLALTAPANTAGGIGTGNIILEWTPLKGATQYQWQLDDDTDFSTVPSGFEGNTQGSSARSPALAAATTYYWRVRATAPVLSPWSAKWSFTTSLGATVIAPELLSPKAGASGMPLQPVFQWSAIAGANSYELLVSTDASLANPIIMKTGDYRLPATAWQSNINLDYNTTYFWKVRASSANSYSAWSAVGAFTTELPPSPPSPPSLAPATEPSLSLPQLSSLPPPSSLAPATEPPPSPPPLSSSPPVPPAPAPATEPSLSPPPLSSSPPVPPAPPLPTQPALPDWFLYLISALLLTTVLLLITLLVMVAGIRRS